MSRNLRFERSRRLGLVCLALGLAVGVSQIASGAPADLSQRVEAAPTVDPAQLKSAINAEVRRALRVAPELGVHVTSLSDGEDIYTFRAETPRIVASNVKLVTSAAALDRLGPGFFFETPIAMRGVVADGVLDGDLAIVGGGDPDISGRHYFGDSFAVFREWAAALRARGIRRIEGDLVLVTGFFDEEEVHPDWPRGQLDRWYEAPVAALSFNANTVHVEVQPEVGGTAHVRLDPPVQLFPVVGTVQVTDSARRQLVHIRRPATAADAERRRTIELSGRIWRRSSGVGTWITVPDPTAYFGAVLRDALREEGIAVAGRTLAVDRLRPRADAPWQLLHVHRTDLLTALGVVNKRSQNFYAESVLKTLGARLCGEGSWEAGLRIVREFLDEVGIDGDWSMVDGSGMSRRNRFTPRQITSLLRHMFDHRWGGEFLRTLPFGGEAESSLSSRFVDPPSRGNVFAKTGTLNGVSTLSGFAKARSGKIYVFSILLNSTSASWRGQQAQDRIVQALIDEG
ncbi:MAG: D-alanyl-D-alanine carboxypeptidase/D-alanyl-D-alanine-endopeptidase [Acidobacteriota bacterium]